MSLCLYNYIISFKSQAKVLALVVRIVNNAIHRISHYPACSVVCFVDTCPLDSDLSAEQRYQAFKQLRPDVFYL